MLWPEVDNNARCKAEDININRGPQQMLNTENLWLNVIFITSFKFNSNPFICLFSTIIPIFSPSYSSLYIDDIGVSAAENKACDTHISQLISLCVFEIYR